MAAPSRRLPADPLPVEAPPALLIYFSPDSLAVPIMTGAPLRARPRASSDASGHRLVTFSLKALRCGSPGKTSRPDPALHGPSTGANLLIRRQRKQAVSNEWKWRSRIANSELLGRRNWCSSGATNCIGVGVQNCAGTHPFAGAEQATKSATDQQIGGIDSGQHKASI